MSISAGFMSHFSAALFLMSLHLCFLYIFSVETAQIQKKAAAVNARLEDHSRACSELKRLQVNTNHPALLTSPSSVDVRQKYCCYYEYLLIIMLSFSLIL